MSTRRSLARVFVAAALVLQGAALHIRAQSGAPRKAAAQQQQPAQGDAKKTSTRPEDAAGRVTAGPAKPEGARGQAKEAAADAPRYAYEFRHPDFFVYFIHIEHDDAGRGLIRFERRSDTEQLTEPLTISPAALARIRARWDALGFLDSQANYQGERTYPSMGQTRLTLRRGERERTAEFNYSRDKDAQGLAEEYRRVGEQALFVFEIGVALESQPLETPKLLSRLESLIDRNYLSDRRQLVPLVRELTGDERVPLVGRNHAARILKKLEKLEQ